MVLILKNAIRCVPFQIECTKVYDSFDNFRENLQIFDFTFSIFIIYCKLALNSQQITKMIK